MKKAMQRLRLLSLFLVLTMVVGLGAPQTAIAASNKTVKNPATVSLSLNKSYSKYDVTGDGKADTIKISGQEDDYAMIGLKITINGKTAFQNKTAYYYDLDAIICTLNNGKVFLYLYNPADNGDAEYCGLYQYQNGKLKCVLNMNKFYGLTKVGYHTFGAIQSVSGNTVTVEMYQQNYELGGIFVTFEYKYSKGKLVKASNTAKAYRIWAADNNGGILTAQKNMSVYTKTDGKNKAFSLKAGQQIKVIDICIKAGKMFIKVKRLSDGKTGYIKCIEGNPKDFIPPFVEVQYAG